MAVPDSGNIVGVLKICFVAEEPAPKDWALTALALRYAKSIDEGGDVIKLGPLLLNALEALQMSPRSRAAVQKGVKAHDAPKSPLDELAAARARKSGAEAVDAATS